MRIKLFSGYVKDLPFASDGASLFLAWIMMIMVFLASLAMMGTLAIGNMVNDWNRSVTGSLSVQIMPPANSVYIGADTLETMMSQVEETVKLLQKTKGVASVRVLSLDELENLLKPWLGDAVLDDEFPIPRLIDVTLDNDAKLDTDALAKEIAEIAPDSLLDIHRTWIEKMMDFAKTLKLTAWLVLALVLITTGLSAVYAAITNLEVHKLPIELLHLIGAKDKYISLIFAKRALLLSFAGAAAGLLLALPAGIMTALVAADLKVGTTNGLELQLTDLLMIAALPFMAAVLAAGASYLTIKIKLRETL